MQRDLSRMDNMIEVDEPADEYSITGSPVKRRVV
jgi:hypothetical protein